LDVSSKYTPKPVFAPSYLPLFWLVASTFSPTFAVLITHYGNSICHLRIGYTGNHHHFDCCIVAFWRQKIPELMRGIGQGVREFNSAKSNLKQEIEEGMKKDNTAAPKAKETEETKA